MQSRCSRSTARGDVRCEEVSTLPLCPCAYARAGILTDPKRREGSVIPKGAKHPRLRCDVCARGFRVRIPSAQKLAKSIRRRLVCRMLRAEAHTPTANRAYSITLTCRSGDEAEVRAKVQELASLVPRCARRAGLLCALDRAPKTGRWHVHALAVVPADFDIARITDWWRRLWPRKDTHGNDLRPTREAQHARPLGLTPWQLRSDLDRTLAHHLGRTRKGIPIPDIPTTANRVTAVGTLIGVWERVCCAKGVPIAPSPPRPQKPASRAKKVSTLPLPRTPQWVRGVSCAWCGRRFPKGKRRDSRYCGASCGRSASRALRQFAGRLAKAKFKLVEARVAHLEDRGMLRRDAIREALKFSDAPGLAPRSGTVDPAVFACKCGKPLAKRLSAKTCGDDACRTKAWRTRRSDARFEVKAPAVLSALLRLHRLGVFTFDEAAHVGVGHGMRPGKTRRLIKELVEDGLVRVMPGKLYEFI